MIEVGWMGGRDRCRGGIGRVEGWSREGGGVVEVGWRKER